MDRISLIRRMIEEGEQQDLFSARATSHKPWDFAATREAKAKGRKTIAKFNPKSRFSDVKISVIDAVEQGDKVVVRWRLRGKWTQPIMGLKPSGLPVDITGVNFYRFVGDKIVEQNGEFDGASFMQQARGGISAEECEETMVQFSRPPDFEVLTVVGFAGGGGERAAKGAKGSEKR
jgi:hypothetical protein